MIDAKLKLKIEKKNNVFEITVIMNNQPKQIYILDMFNDGKYETNESFISIGNLKDLKDEADSQQ